MTILDFIAIYQKLTAQPTVSCPINWQLYGVNEANVVLANGVPLAVTPLTPNILADLLIIIGIEYSQLQQFLRNTQGDNSALKMVLRRNKRVLTLSTASFILAELSLLTHERVVTHWQFEGIFRKRYPQLDLKSHLEFVDNGQYCSAVGISGAIYCLSQHLMSFTDKNIVNRCVTIITQQAHLPDTLWLSESLVYKQHHYHAILTIQNFIDCHYGQALSLATLATKFHLSESTLKRHFKIATNISVSQYYQLIRIARMKYLLTTTKLSIEQICQEIGYTDSRFVRRLFSKTTGKSAKIFRLENTV